MGTTASRPSPLAPAFERMKIWELKSARRLLQDYKDRDLDFGLDAQTLGELVGGDKVWAEAIIDTFGSTNGIVNALAFICGACLICSGPALEKASLVFDAMDFDSTEQISMDEMTIVFLCCTRGVCVMAGVGVVPSDDALEAVTLQAYRELNKSSAQSITKTEFTDWVLRFAASGSSSSKEVSLDAALHQFGVVQQLHDEPSNLAPELETKLPAFPHEQDASLLDDRSDDHGYDPGVNDLDKDAECAKSGSTLTSAQFDEEYNIPDDAVQQECTRAAESTPELPASKTLEADNPSVDDTDTAENNPWGDNEAIDATEDSVGEGDDYNDEATTTTRSRPQSSRPAHSEDDNAADELQEAAKTVDDVIDTIVKSDAGEPVGDTENEMPSGVSPAVDDGNDQDGDNYDDEFAEASQASVNIVQPPLESKIDDSQSFDEYADTELPTPDKIGDEKTAPQDDISKEISIHTETPHDFDEQAHTIMPSESEKVETPSNPTDLNAYDTYDYENSAFSSASGLPPPDPPELTLSQDDSATEHTPDNDGIRIEPTQ